MYNISNMSNTKLICFRVDDEQKARIEAAASIQGKTVTTFVKEAVMNAVAQIESRPPKQSKPHAGVSTFFRALCQEAGQGGSFGFRAVGHQFAKALGSEVPPAVRSLDEWQDDLNALAETLEPTRSWEPTTLTRRPALVDAIWGWFTKHYPNAMKLVPARRRDQFLIGIVDAFTDETIGLHV